MDVQHMTEDQEIQALKERLIRLEAKFDMLTQCNQNKQDLSIFTKCHDRICGYILFYHIDVFPFGYFSCNYT